MICRQVIEYGYAALSIGKTLLNQMCIRDRDFINAVIKPEDAVTYDLDERAGHCEIHFQFGGVQKNVKWMGVPFSWARPSFMKGCLFI